MKWKKENILKVVSCFAAVAVTAGSVSALAYAAQANQEKDSSTQSESADADTTPTADADLLNEKDETVYVLAEADGNVKKIIVSDWLKNLLGDSQVEDQTQLSDISNVKGDETGQRGSDGSYTWPADGGDIYYQGTIEKELPVNMSIEYLLDGKKITPADLAGKSGKVTIRLTYKNTQKKTVTVNGKAETVYVPFVAVTGLALDNEHFRNVEISNGKVVSDGDRSIVMGFALPGMQESLKLDKDKLEFPESVEITADVTDFSLLTTLTVVTNELFNELDLDDVDDLDGLKEAVTQLQDACTQLLDGSSALYEGLGTLLTKSGELISGVGQLADGAKDLKEGASSLSDGTQELKDGTGELNDGLKELSGQSGNLKAGAKQVFETLLSTANTQLKEAGLSVPTLTIENYSTVLNNAIAGLDSDTVYQMAYQSALSQVKKAIEDKSAEIYNQVYAAAEQKVKAGVLESQGLTEEQYNALPSGQRQAIDEAVNQQMQSDSVVKEINRTVQDTKDNLIDQQMKSQTIQDSIRQAVQDAENGSSSLHQLKKQLDAYSQFYQGLQDYTDGVDQAYKGSQELNKGASNLNSGAEQLKNGAKDLSDGVSALQSGSSALLDGVSALNDGAMQLNDGMKEFKEEGIDKLAEAFNGDFEDLIGRFQAMADASREYRSFAGISDQMAGNVKFIYRTDSIGG
ncbi:hypothetical protein [Massiliimalia massiliensis]|uniref:hypothetical protein n=1 Tax=Massiliimalia massiliensis TaxID=1852384 RepID=UPI000985B936|nr:hypothetical protein [Massiliimalia massiliensis]